MLKLFIILFLTGCNTVVGTVDTTSRYDKGRRIYSATCVQCHGDPRVGNFGPPVYGSSFPLLRLKINEGKYPAKYVPKRQSSMMPIIKLPRDDIFFLYCYLNDRCKFDNGEIIE